MRLPAAGTLALSGALFFGALHGADREIDAETIRVKTETVSLSVVVTDRHGNNIKNLRQEDFRVFEDGVLQELSGVSPVQDPISVALLIDSSGSTEFQLERIRQDAMQFVKLLRPDDSVAVLSFADEVVLLEQFSLDHKKNPEVIRKIKPGGLSAVYEAVWLSLEQVLKPEYGRKALVMLSDGVDNRSQTVAEEETLELARKTDAPIYCIYFNTNKDRWKRIPPIVDHAQWPFPRPGGSHPEYAAGREYLSKLASYSGGLLIDASRIDKVGPAFRRIIEELSSQYSIGYRPKNIDDNGAFRRIEVRMSRKDLTARTRQGYYLVR